MDDTGYNHFKKLLCQYLSMKNKKDLGQCPKS